MQLTLLMTKGSLRDTIILRNGQSLRNYMNQVRNSVPYESICWWELMLAVSPKSAYWRNLRWCFTTESKLLEFIRKTGLATIFIQKIID